MPKETPARRVTFVLRNVNLCVEGCLEAMDGAETTFEIPIITLDRIKRKRTLLDSGIVRRVVELFAPKAEEITSEHHRFPAKETRLLAPLMPSMAIFKADLKLAGIQYIDAQGRRADFHSLRHTLGTNLARAGTFPRVAMEVMRHSDMKLTSKTYTDAGLLPTTDAITRLPSLHSSDQWTQIGTQNLFRKGQDQSSLVKKSSFAGASEVPENQEVSHALSGSVMTGREDEKGCRARTRTYGETLEPEQLAKACTLIGTQGLEDPGLATVVNTWPDLSPAIKAAILAIITSTKSP